MRKTCWSTSFDAPCELFISEFRSALRLLCVTSDFFMPRKSVLALGSQGARHDDGRDLAIDALTSKLDV